MPHILGSFLGLWHPAAEIMGPQNLGHRTEGPQRSCVAQSEAPQVLGVSRCPGQPRSPTPFLVGSRNRRNRNLQSTEAEKEQFWPVLWQVHETVKAQHGQRPGYEAMAALLIGLPGHYMEKPWADTEKAQPLLHPSQAWGWTQLDRSILRAVTSHRRCVLGSLAQPPSILAGPLHVLLHTHIH